MCIDRESVRQFRLIVPSKKYRCIDRYIFTADIPCIHSTHALTVEDFWLLIIFAL